MSASQSASRKRPFNLTLSDNLVAQASSHAGNLSATTESLRPRYMGSQPQAKRSRQPAAEACAKDWNAVHEAVGSFADDHSTL